MNVYTYYQDFRKVSCQFIKKYFTNVLSNYLFLVTNNVKKVGNYLGELEMSVITVILNISIYIFELNENNNSYKLVYKNIG